MLFVRRPKSILNGRDDLIKQSGGPIVDDPFADDPTPVWLRCALSHAPLTSGPVVCDALGHLMLKEDLLVALLKRRLPPQLTHLRSAARDVFACRLTRREGRAWCPVTGDELLRGARVCRPCGCVLSQVAFELSPERCEACGTRTDSSAPRRELSKASRGCHIVNRV